MDIVDENKMFIRRHLFVRPHTIHNGITTWEIRPQVRFHYLLDRHIRVQISEEYKIDIGTAYSIEYRQFLSGDHSRYPAVPENR
jgi:hypothetical protein